MNMCGHPIRSFGCFDWQHIGAEFWLLINPMIPWCRVNCSFTTLSLLFSVYCKRGESQKSHCSTWDLEAMQRGQGRYSSIVANPLIEVTILLLNRKRRLPLFAAKLQPENILSLWVWMKYLKQLWSLKSLFKAKATLPGLKFSVEFEYPRVVLLWPYIPWHYLAWGECNWYFHAFKIK